MFIDRWCLHKEDVIHIYGRILLSHKKEWNIIFCESIDVPEGYYAKWNKPVRKKQIPYYFTYTQNLKNNINKQQKRKRLIDRENKLMVDIGEEVWGMGKKSEGIEKYKLVVTR